MSNYTKTTDFEAKDSLPTGDSGKIIRGSEFETEFDAISTAIATKADTAGPTFTGTLTFETISDGTIGVTAFVDEDDMSSDSATLVPTQQSVKAYVDAQVTAQDLDFQADSGGALSIDLDSETLTFTGGTGIDTSGSGNAVTFAIDSTVATLTGTQTLTNKTLTSPDVNTPDIDGGTIDGATIATSDITVGTGKTLDVSSGTLTLADNQISGDKVEGGTIASTTITSLASTTIDTTNVEVTNIKAKDGTSAGSIADTTGVVTLASSVLTTTDINGGTIDGATIGATTAAAGSFTTVSATGNITVGGTVDGRDIATDGTKLDTVETNADVTDTTNVTAAGAVMDSELTNETAVKSLDQGVATTDSPTFAGLTTTADVSFGDNDKAVFGAGSDLSIFSDGGAFSYINNTQGVLRIRNTSDDQDVVIQSDNGSGGITDYFLADGSSGSAKLYNYGSEKLATTSTGIDVTGTVVADGLTVDSGTSDTVATFQSTDQFADLALTDSGGTSFIRQSNGSLILEADRANASAGSSAIIKVDGSEAMRIISSGNVGIGTSSPAALLHVLGSAQGSTDQVIFESNNGGGSFGPVLNLKRSSASPADNDSVGMLKFTGNNSALAEHEFARIVAVMNDVTDTTEDGSLLFSTSSAGSISEAMRIDSNGDVAIGTTAAGGDRILSLRGNSAVLGYDSSDTAAVVQSGNVKDLKFCTGTDTFGDNERMRIDSSGLVGIGTISPNQDFELNKNNANVNLNIRSSNTGNATVLFGDQGDASAGSVTYDNNVNEMIFKVNNQQEAMRIDSSGNLLVGNTVTNPAAADNAQGIALGNSGILQASKTNGATAYFNRKTSDGTIVDFRKDGSTVGSIGAKDGDIYIGTGDTQIRFSDGADDIRPTSTDGSGRDAAIDLGNSSNRFKDIYLSGGAYLGGTGSANKLDDYEEGTWTPAVDNADAYGFTIATPTGANGNYTKVGRLVTLKGGFTSLDSTDTIVVSDRFGVSGLPFTPSGSYTAGTGAQGSCIVYSSFGSGILATGTVTHTTDKIWIVIDTVHGSPTWGVDVNISISYIVD